MRVVLIAATEFHNYIPGYSPGEGQLPMVADELAEQAGRLCYLSYDRPNPKTRANEDYIANILAKQHFSVLEHGSATFYIDGVSRNFTHELIRHRHLSPSEVSQRYVNVETFRLVVPPDMRGHEYQQRGANTTGTTGEYFDMSDTEIMEQYKENVEYLVSQGLERKEARQAARSGLPGGLETKILITGNHRAWRDVLVKRLSPQADKEFQAVARELLAKLRQLAPNTYQDFE